MTTNKTKQLLVIGNGMVGQHFIEQWLALQQHSSDWQLTVFAGEDRPAYDRVHLSDYFSDGDADKLQLVADSFYQDNKVQLKLNEPVLAIDRDSKTVSTAKASYAYDKLVMATGSYPFVPPISGNDQPHCLVYRTIADLEAINTSSDGARVGVVIGGGLLGLEAANALKLQGLEAHVVEFAPQLMPVQLDKDGGELLRSKIEQLGVSVHTDKATSSITAGSEQRLQLNFADGSVLQTDLIVFSAGIRPQDALGKDAGLELGTRGGIVINNQCQTSDSNIYAIGECALYQGQLFGLVAPGYQMARTAAAVLNGDDSLTFTGADMSTKLKLLGVDVGSIGDAHGRTPGSISLRYRNDLLGEYRKLVLSPDGKQLLGAVLVASWPGLRMGHVRDGQAPGAGFQLALDTLRELKRKQAEGVRGDDLQSLANRLGADPLQMQAVLEQLQQLDWVGLLDENQASSPPRYVMLVDWRSTRVAPLLKLTLLADGPGSAAIHKQWHNWLLADVL